MFLCIFQHNLSKVVALCIRSNSDKLLATQPLNVSSQCKSVLPTTKTTIPAFMTRNGATIIVRTYTAKQQGIQQMVTPRKKDVLKVHRYDMPVAMRKKELTKLRNLGNYHHNIQVLETRCGQLLTVKRPSALEESKPEHFLPCSYYYGFFDWRHSKTHVFKNYDDEDDDNST